MENYDIIIIGGGAAGCFAACRAAMLSPKKRILIIEKNPLLMKKLAITGKGRCNITNNCGLSDIMRNIPRNPVFMCGAFSRFAPADTMAFFASLGVLLKTERGGRVFPVSDKSAEIIAALENKLALSNVGVAVGRAESLIIEDNAVKGVATHDARYYSDSVILATGGMSYPKTGSTGDGYEIARKAGHTVTPLKPSLVPIVTVESCVPAMGLSLKNVGLTLKENDGILFKERGEMLFTHFGVSGPLALSASSYIDEPESKEYTLLIDLKPALNEQALDSRLLRDFGENKNRQFKNALSGLLPKKLIPLFIERSTIPPEKNVNSITRRERGILLSLFKSYPLTVKALRPLDEAIITDGGISVAEINPKTMQSKLVDGLYFAGEIIDVSGLTGGFNLQIAFSTANAAVLSITDLSRQNYRWV